MLGRATGQDVAMAKEKGSYNYTHFTISWETVESITRGGCIRAGAHPLQLSFPETKGHKKRRITRDISIKHGNSLSENSQHIYIY